MKLVREEILLKRKKVVFGIDKYVLIWYTSFSMKITFRHHVFKSEEHRENSNYMKMLFR